MNPGNSFHPIMPVFVFLSLFFAGPSFAEEAADTTFEQNKKEVLKDIETAEHSLKATKSCVSLARTAQELDKCLTDEATIKFQHVQDMLLESGMSWEERKLQRLRRD